MFEPVVAKRHPEVAEALDWLTSQNPGAKQNRQVRARPAMSGTGCCVFVCCESRNAALKLLGNKPAHFGGFVARGCNRSPLDETSFEGTAVSTLQAPVAPLKFPG